MEFHELANLFPLIGGVEFDQLVEDVKVNGVREPIWLLDSKILDGRNRYRAASVAGAECVTQVYSGQDPLGFVISMNLHRRHLNESQRAMVGARLVNIARGQVGVGRPKLDRQICLSNASEKLNVSGSAIKTAKKVQEEGCQQLNDAVDSGSIAVSDAVSIVTMPDNIQEYLVGQVISNEHKTLKKAKRKEDIEQQIKGIESGSVAMPDGVFEVISIDPPWPYRDGQAGGPADYDPSGHRASNPYPEMTLEEITAIELPSADSCVLWFWTTHKFMRHSFSILDEWGFQDRAILTWAKDRMGLGRWLRSQSEFCIMATKGSPLINLTNQTTVLHGPMREHSRKPEEFYSFVESLCPGRKLDYFSRGARVGWSQIGNDKEKFS